MLRTRLATSYIKRTIRPTYAWTQATPKSLFLDPAFDRSVAVWPGMVMARTGGDLVTLIGKGTGTATAQLPVGLVGNYIGGDGIDELLDAGINALAVWVLSPDAEFEILAPAFDTSQTWTDPTDGTDGTLVYASVSGAGWGKLTVTADGTKAAVPVARLLKVNSATKITIGGLRGTA